MIKKTMAILAMVMFLGFSTGNAAQDYDDGPDNGAGIVAAAALAFTTVALFAAAAHADRYVYVEQERPPRHAMRHGPVCEPRGHERDRHSQYGGRPHHSERPGYHGPYDR